MLRVKQLSGKGMIGIVRYLYFSLKTQKWAKLRELVRT